MSQQRSGGCIQWRPATTTPQMKQIIIIIAIILLPAVQGFGRTVISGCVKNDEGKTIDFVSVTASAVSSPKTILSATFTDGNGLFHLTIDNDCDSLILKASGMEIAPARIIIPNRTGNYDLHVEERVVELKEVIVNAKKIYSHGDTINYNVASFLSQTDQSVADVLRKMPGITVSDAGQISYQGKPIKNLYIRSEEHTSELQSR